MGLITEDFTDHDSYFHRHSDDLNWFINNPGKFQRIRPITEQEKSQAGRPELTIAFVGLYQGGLVKLFYDSLEQLKKAQDQI